MDNTITKQEMESLKALSDINLKVSEAKNLLFKLQEDETAYLVTREQKAMDRIQKVVEESQCLVLEADQNHAQIKALIVEVSAFVEHLLRIQANFQGLLAEFEERNVQWERDIGKQQDDIVEIRKAIKIETNQVENDRKNVELARKKLTEDQKKLDSDRGTLERAIKRLKENRI
jgi:hypothetical protein